MRFSDGEAGGDCASPRHGAVSVSLPIQGVCVLTYGGACILGCWEAAVQTGSALPRLLVLVVLAMVTVFLTGSALVAQLLALLF